MSELDEQLFSAAKLFEVVRGDLDGDDRALPHAGVVGDRRDRAALSFVESAVADDLDAAQFEDTELGKLIASKQVTDELTEALKTENASQLAFASGVTEEELTGGQLRLASVLLEELKNNDAPAFVSVAGNPETGKTNTGSLLVEMQKARYDDYLVLSNARSWELVDVQVTSAHDLVRELLDHRDVPKAVFIDEASTSFDARTYSCEISQQYTPLAKRYAKLNVDVEVAVCHTGKDLHPERKRLTTLAIYKTEKKVAQLFEKWDADADFPTDRLLQGDVDELEPTSAEYDPDDAAPWAWNLEPELFALDLDWSELLEEVKERGPDE